MRNDAASVDANVQKYHPRNLLRPRAGVALCVTAKLAAKCSYGSLATEAIEAGQRRISALLPIPDMSMRCSRTPLCAKSGLTHRSKIYAHSDHLVGTRGASRAPDLRR